MTGFIEVTEKQENSKVLCPTARISAVLETKDGVFIETGIDTDGESTGILVKETFAEVKEKMKNSFISEA